MKSSATSSCFFFEDDDNEFPNNNIHPVLVWKYGLLKKNRESGRIDKEVINIKSGGNTTNNM